jgi:hypothetical protein
MKRVYGPYKGSKQNGGRPIYVIKKKGGKKTTSTNKARLDYKKKTGKSKISLFQNLTNSLGLSFF